MLKKTTHFLVLLVILIAAAACRKGPQEETMVYSNDFDQESLESISGGLITRFNNTSVLGRYNNGGFGLQLNNLPEHDLVEVSFDLYVHDSWDGNDKEPDGPDIWKLEIEGVDFISSTFSNKECPYTCFPQSYPFNYLNSNQQPKNGAFQSDLPGVCHWLSRPRSTSLYKIVKTVRHNGSGFSIRCLDKLVQSNTAEPLCDESWSVDNLLIKTIKLD